MAGRMKSGYKTKSNPDSTTKRMKPKRTTKSNDGYTPGGELNRSYYKYKK